MGLFRKRASVQAAAGQLPDGVRVYAVGDIHGCDDLLADLLEKIFDDRCDAQNSCHLVFVGDYVDRGPDSRGVIERLSTGITGMQTHFLRGNHDQVLLEFLEDPARYRAWKEYGGSETLLSYAVAPPRSDSEAEVTAARDRFRAVLPPRHEAFLRGLKLSVQIGDYYFVHAGVRPGIALERQVPEDQMWIRDEFLRASTYHGATIVHGHTPAEQPHSSRRRVGVDTGAYASGHLTAAVLEGTSCRFLQT